MKTIPKYIDNLLKRRTKLALDLIAVSVKIDEYCEKLGIDLGDSSNSLLTDVSIYCEPWNAYDNTKSAIKKVLQERENNEQEKANT